MFQSKIAKNVMIGTCLVGALLFGSTPVSVCADFLSDEIVISSAEELIAFSESIKEGTTYYKQTVVLGADIDLTDRDFTPIGEFGAKSFFRGTFDGKGHSISGLNLVDDTRTQNNALFGHLGGTVRNLSVYGYVSGNCCGGIASHIAGTAQIINCSSFVTIDANRCGGIGDNLGTADVIGCYSASTDSKGNPLPLVSYDAHRIFLCASVGPITSEPRPEIINGCIENQPLDACFDDFLNENVEVLGLCGYTDITLWQDNRPISTVYEFTPSLIGKGTEKDPVIIQNYEDFASFRTLIANGETFAGQIVVQTEDIDFTFTRKTGETFPLEQLPIAMTDTTNTFNGTYDGRGHLLENYYCTTLSRGSTNALFGNLSGIVKNVGLESGYIQGSFVSSFAITATSRKATFINCYSKLDLDGSVRASAFTDNFVGLVVGCYYLNPEGDYYMAAYNTTTLAYCYNTGDKIILEGTSEFEPIECIALPYDELVNGRKLADGRRAEDLNAMLYRSRPLAAEIAGIKLYSLYHMEKDGFHGKVIPGNVALSTILVDYPYELLTVTAIGISIVILIVCRERRDHEER